MPKLYKVDFDALSTPVKSEPKEKKPRSEKQIEAFKKTQEARKRKIEEKLMEKKSAQEEPVQEPVQKPVQEKPKRQRKPKQEPAKEPEPAPELEQAVEGTSKVEKPKKKKQKKVALPVTVEESVPKETSSEASEQSSTSKSLVETSKNLSIQSDEEPPKWFKAYILGVKEEQALAAKEKKPKKQVQFEAQEKAHMEWQKPVVRQRVQNTVNDHMQKLYAQIFSRRLN